MYCKLLYTQEPIVINPVAAEVLGVNEAIIVQQVHYWLNINEKAKINFYNGRYWTYNTYENWQKTNFRFFSERTLKRIFKKLEEKEILIKDNFNKTKYDRTLWITINYEKLDELMAEYEEKMQLKKMKKYKKTLKFQQSAKLSLWVISTKCQVVTLKSDNLSLTIPETNKETNKDICTTQNKSVVVEEKNKNIELIENRTHLKAMSNNMKNKASKWNTERLDKAIDIFISKEGEYFSLLEKIYKDDKNFVPKVNTKTQTKSQSNNNPKFKTRFHNINETFRNYPPDELEKLLRESQKGKF